MAVVGARARAVVQFRAAAALTPREAHVLGAAFRGAEAWRAGPGLGEGGARGWLG